MRIGVNTLFLVPGDVGGTEVYLRQNLKFMVADNQDDTFILFTNKDNEESLRQDLVCFSNTEFIQLPFRAAIRPVRIVFEQTLLPWLVRKSNVDVLWSPGYTAPLVCSCPQVVTIHDLQYKSHPDDVSFLERITLDFLVKNACRKCDKIITVSHYSKQELLRFDFAPKQKLIVVYEGVDPIFADQSRSKELSVTDLPPDNPYILCVAHSYPHKQVHLLVEAFGIVMDKIPHHLVLVGKPRRGEVKVQQSLERLRDNTKVHRISELQYSELQAVYQKADLFVLPSEYEGFGLPILEAMLAGVSVITTDKASLPEIGGECAIYIDKSSPDTLAHAIMQSINMDVAKKQNRIKNGKAWAAAFTWKKSASETIKILTAINSIEH